MDRSIDLSTSIGLFIFLIFKWGKDQLKHSFLIESVILEPRHSSERVNYWSTNAIAEIRCSSCWITRWQTTAIHWNTTNYCAKIFSYYRLPTCGSETFSIWTVDPQMLIEIVYMRLFSLELMIKCDENSPSFFVRIQNVDLPPGKMPLSDYYLIISFENLLQQTTSRRCWNVKNVSTIEIDRSERRELRSF